MRLAHGARFFDADNAANSRLLEQALLLELLVKLPDEFGHVGIPVLDRALALEEKADHLDGLLGWKFGVLPKVTRLAGRQQVEADARPAL